MSEEALAGSLLPDRELKPYQILVHNAQVWSALGARHDWSR